MKKLRIPLRGGLEFDALTGWRRYLKNKAGKWAFAKRQYNRRMRRKLKAEGPAA